MDVQQRVAEFDAENGESVFHEGWVYFRNGALREANPAGLLKDPPSDCYERARRTAFYHRLKHEQALQRFNERREDLARAATFGIRNGGPVPLRAEEARVALEALADTVRKAQVDLERAEKLVGKTEPDHVRQRREQEAANKQASAELLEAVKSIEL